MRRVLAMMSSALALRISSGRGSSSGSFGCASWGCESCMVASPSCSRAGWAGWSLSGCWLLPLSCGGCASMPAVSVCEEVRVQESSAQGSEFVMSKNTK